MIEPSRTSVVSARGCGQVVPPVSAVKALTRPSLYANEWRRLIAQRRRVSPIAALRAESSSSILFIGAHPDDETFAAGATLAALRRANATTHVLCLTRGEAAAGATDQTAQLAQDRQHEFGFACAALDATSAVTLELPDGRLAERVIEVQSAVDAAIRRVCATHVLTVWALDPHPDHAAAGAAANLIGARAGLPVFGLPIWAQHWTHPETVSLDRLDIFEHTDADIRAKYAAAAAYTSQTRPITADRGAVLPPWFLAWTDELAFQS